VLNFAALSTTPNASGGNPSAGVSRFRKWLRRLGHFLVAAYLVLFAVGFVVFLRERPVPATPWLDIPPPAPGVRANLASFLNGGSVAVSSFDLFRSHNPMYLIDGTLKPTNVEKWATLRGDRQPFAEIRLAARADVDEVDLELGGAFEDAGYTMRTYVLYCLRDEPGGEEVVSELPVSGNTEARPKYRLRCPATDRVRIEFEVEGRKSAREVVRMYEFQVWGTPLVP
jgi:hypothetical protein